MRNIWKRTAAAVLALVLCLSLAGCYNENNTWAARKGDDTMPIGGYIYYLYSAYSEARNQVDSDTAVLDAEIDGVDASQWITDRALNYLNAYYYISDKFSEYGLELTEDDQTQIDNTTTNFWRYYQSTFEDDLGIARDSFSKAYSEYTVKFQKVMEAMYGEGGELALAAGELEDYFTETYLSYEYFYVPLTTTNDDGESETLTSEEQADIQDQLQTYVDSINEGEMTVSEAADDYASETSGESTYYQPSPTKGENITSELATALEGADEGEAVVAETSNALYVIRKLSIADAYDEVEADEDQYISLLADMKGEEFNDYVLEQAQSVEGVEPVSYTHLAWPCSTASSAVKTILPQAAPGEAARAEATGLAAFRASGSNWGWSRASSCLGSSISRASCSVFMPSSIRSQAILMAAAGVRLPLRVWSI